MQTLEPCGKYAHQLTRVKCMRKMTCEVYLSFKANLTAEGFVLLVDFQTFCARLLVGYSGSPSTVNETNCNKKRSLKKKTMSSTNFWTCPTRNRLRKSAISHIVLEKLVLQFPHLTHDEDGF